MSHGHGSAAATNRGRLVVVLCMSLAILVLEIAGACAANSLALLADAGHVLTDVAGMVMTLVAIWVAGRPARVARTFGFLRLEVLAAGANATLLIGISAFVLIRAWVRLAAPPEIAAGPMLAVAVVGTIADGISLHVLRGAQHESLNVRGAYLEVLGDVLGSAALVVAAVAISVTGWTAADALASVLIGFMILPRTWSLLRDATNVLLEATPRGIDLDAVRRHICAAPGVRDVHDLHAWTITSGRTWYPRTS
jgi:cobalt-zinc-cadmium efflux system protein